MELRVLQYFLAVVREENISKAAKTLHLTQPTLSRQIQDLEDELGTQLFIRGRHLVLTDAGIMLRRRAEEVVQLMGQIEKDFSSRDEVEGLINIGVGGLSYDHILPDMIQGFHLLYPKVRFDIYSNDATHVRERLDKGLLDFGFLLEPVDIGKYDFIRLSKRERWGLLVNTDSELAKKDVITTEDLRSLPIMTTAREPLQKEISLWMHSDWNDLNIVATYNLVTHAASMVSRGVGSALTIEGAVNLLDPGRFSFIPLEPDLTISSVLAWKKVYPITGASGRFLEHIQSYSF